jgi:hypothetical protein
VTLYVSRFNKKKQRSPKNLLSEGERVRNALIVAKNMLSRGSKIEDVIKITGLTEKEIKKYVDLSFSEISKVKQIQLKLM